MTGQCWTRSRRFLDPKVLQCRNQCHGTEFFEVGIRLVGYQVGLWNVSQSCGKLPSNFGRHTVRHTWNIICNWSMTEFQSEHLRPLVQHTNGFETILQGFQDKKMLRSLEEFFSVQAKQVQRSWSDGRHSIAVKLKISNLREVHSLRDKVLSGDLDLKINDILSIQWQVGIDKSAFLTFYERSLLSLTDLTEHQNEVLQELRDAGTHEQGVIHLSAAAGAGKTFIAVKWVLDHLRMSSGKVLYIAPNKALVFHFIRWLLAFAHADRDSLSRYLSRLLVLYEPYDQVQVPTRSFSSQPQLTWNHVKSKYLTKRIAFFARTRTHWSKTAWKATVREAQCCCLTCPKVQVPHFQLIDTIPTGVQSNS